MLLYWPGSKTQSEVDSQSSAHRSEKVTSLTGRSCPKRNIAFPGQSYRAPGEADLHHRDLNTRQLRSEAGKAQARLTEDPHLHPASLELIYRYPP